MSNDVIDGPGKGDWFAPADNINRLLLIKPLRHEVVPNQFKPGETQTLVHADVVILAENAAHGEHKEYPDAHIYSAGIVSQTKENCGTGRYVLGRLGQGQAKGGNKPPYVLGDPTDADKQVAVAYLSTRAEPPF